MCSLLVACDFPKQEDTERLRILKEKYEGKFEFRLEENLYLIARNLEENEVSENSAQEIYRLFWFQNDKVKRRNTNYVYLNILDNSGEFKFQLAWDEAKSKFIVSNRPYY